MARVRLKEWPDRLVDQVCGRSYCRLRPGPDAVDQVVLVKSLVFDLKFNNFEALHNYRQLRLYNFSDPHASWFQALFKVLCKNIYNFAWRLLSNQYRTRISNIYITNDY